MGEPFIRSASHCRLHKKLEQKREGVLGEAAGYERRRTRRGGLEVVGLLRFAREERDGWGTESCVG